MDKLPESVPTYWGVTYDASDPQQVKAAHDLLKRLQRIADSRAERKRLERELFRSGVPLERP